MLTERHLKHLKVKISNSVSLTRNGHNLIGQQVHLRVCSQYHCTTNGMNASVTGAIKSHFARTKSAHPNHANTESDNVLWRTLCSVSWYTCL